MAFFDFLGKKRDPMAEAKPFLDQARQTSAATYNPFIEQGGRARDMLEPQYGNMTQNPGDFISKILEQYSQSPGAKFQEDRGLQAMRNSAAAGGFSGTGYDQEQQGEFAQNLSSQDMQQWLQNVLGAQGAGMAGLEGMTDRGFNAGSNLQDIVNGILGNQAQGAFNRGEQKNADRDARIQTLGRILGATAGGAAGAGMFGSTAQGIFGGPAMNGTNPATKSERMRAGMSMGSKAGDIFNLF